MNVEIMRRLAALTPAQRSALEQRLLGLDRLERLDSTVPRRAGPGPYPLSFGQQRLWFVQEMAPASPVYNEPKFLRLTGPLDAGALRGALDTIVARHEALRTTFQVVDGAPVQVVSPAGESPLEIVDLADRPAGEREEEAARLAREEARRPFDLGRGPLFRARLVRLEPRDHLLLLTLHHIVADGWSTGVLFRELERLYGAYLDGQPSPLPDLPIQYADYAIWQRERLRGPVLESQLAFWRRCLEGAPDVLELPSDRPRPATRGDGGDRVPFALSEPLAGALRDLGRSQGATLFMVLLAGFQALLGRYAGQEDLVVGTPVAGRIRPELEPLIGFFVNTLPLRADLGGEPTFRDLVGRAREAALSAYDHQEVPFERVVEELQPARDRAHLPVCQVMLGFQDAVPEPRLPGLAVERYPHDTGTSKFDLALLVRHAGGGLVGHCEFSTDLFDPETVQRLLRQFERLLREAVADPDRSIWQLPLMGASERRQILVEWGSQAANLPPSGSIQGLFEAQARRTPEAIAVSRGPDSLAYGELNRRANRLAHRLRRMGVGRDVPVGLCVEQSFDLIVGMLGILKAGGAYVPLDPAYPRARLALMLADARAAAVVTQRSCRTQVWKLGVPVLCLDDDPTIADEPDIDPEPVTSADDLAYVMYTSGSTGAPKGVAVPHRAVLRLVINTDYVDLGPTDVVAQASTFAFDAATFEIWGALLHGGRLALVGKDVLLSPDDLADWLRREEVSTIFVTTALFNEIARRRPDAFATVKHVLFGGERVDPRWARAVLAAAPPRRLLHVYGPTETTTFATWHLVADVPEDAVTVPIGRPIANTSVYVLDSRRQPVPVGMPGELFIGGPGLARGYLNHPELTAQRFVTEDGLGEPGLRLYRTGDLVRWRPDGCLEFLRRLDNQVKIRGFRVELEEIEATLAQHLAVRDALVTVREDGDEGRRLVAYVVLNDGYPLIIPELRRFLEKRLPRYMIPAAFMALPALPLNASGKINRAELPAPPRLRSGATERAMPTGRLQRQIARVWEDVLGLGPIGARDDFFELGGHSLLAVRLFAELERVTGVKLPLASIFEAPTVEALAERLEQHGWSPAEPILVPIRASGTRPPFFCVHPSGDNVVGYGLLGRHLDPAQPFYALQPGPWLHSASGEPRVEDLAAQYLEEVRRVQPVGPYLLGGSCFGGIVAFEMAQQLRAAGQDTLFLAVLDGTPPRPFEPRDKTLKLSGGRTNGVAAVRAKHAYRARPYPGKITLIWTSEFQADPSRQGHLGRWAKLAQGGLVHHVVVGTHASVFREPHVIGLAARLNACLKEALSDR